MKLLICSSVLVLALVALRITMCQLEAASSDEPQLASARVDHDFRAEDQRMLNIFLGVLRDTGVNGGFVEEATCADLPRGNLKLKQGITLREAMDALVAANPSYDWELENGVINLMPRVGAPLLDTKIAKFQMEATDRELPAVLEDLLRLPEVQAHAATLDLKPGLGQGGPGVYEEHPVPRQYVPIHIDAQNLSIREAFNKIARASPKTVWVYHETDCNGDKTYTVEVVSDY